MLGGLIGVVSLTNSGLLSSDDYSNLVIRRAYITDNDSLNNAKRSGIYMVVGTDITVVPSSYTTMLVLNVWTYTIQLFFAMDHAGMFYRAYYDDNKGWSNSREISLT